MEEACDINDVSHRVVTFFSSLQENFEQENLNYVSRNVGRF